MLSWVAVYWNKINTPCTENIILNVEYERCGRTKQAPTTEMTAELFL